MPRTKTACRSAYIVPVTLSGVQAGTTNDGLTLSANDRVAFLAQATGSENGIYTIRTGQAPIRATDADGAGEFAFGDKFQITAGTLLAGKWFQLVTTGTITIGTTALVFQEATQSVSISGVTMDNTAPSAATVSSVTFDNTAPGAVTIAGVTMSNTAPSQIVLDGEQAPVAGVTPPTPPTVVDHTVTLAAGTNYIVQAGTRGAPVTIALPSSPTTGQHVSVVDTSGQAAAYNITVNGGTKKLLTATGNTSEVMASNYGVLALYYTGTYWKIV